MKDDKYSPRKHSFLTGFIAALAAGAIATGIMLLLSVTFDGVSLPETFGSDLTALMPPPLFDYLHQIIGGDAKHYLFDGILVGQCLVFALSGGCYNLFLASSKLKAFGGVMNQGRGGVMNHARTQGRSLEQPAETKLPLYHGLVLAFLLWLLVGLVFLPVTGAGIFGAQLSIGFVNSIVSLAVVGAVFGLLFVPIQNWLVLRSKKVATSS